MPHQDTAISPSTVICASNDQISSDIAGETVILNISDGVYYGLDPVGTYIWTLVQEPCSVTALHQHLMKEYDVAPEECLEDLLSLLEDLQAHELITVR